MRRAFFFIVALLSATSSFASLPRASMLDRASEHAPAAADPLPETRVWASDVLAPFERPAESELTRALHQAYADLSTTNASGLGRFLSVDPGRDWDMAQPQSWNMYAYVRNNPINHTDPTGKWLDTVVDVVDLGAGIVDMWRSALDNRPVTATQNIAVGASIIGAITPGVAGLGSAVRHADEIADGAQAVASVASRSKNATEMAADLQKKIGKNSVPFETPNTKGHIDLAGKAHYDKATKQSIPTPHVQTKPKHTLANGKVNTGKEETRPATKEDVRTARRLWERANKHERSQ